MKWLVFTDIHGNLPALKAILAEPIAKSCSGIISMGDHTGFGPCPRETYQLLESSGTTILLGNHDWRLMHCHEPQFQGYNWELMRWTAVQMDGLPLNHPQDLTIGNCLMTHAAPGDCCRRVTLKDIPGILDHLPQNIRLLLSGHIHLPWHVLHHGKEAMNPGSAGMPENGRAGYAPYLILDIEDGYSSFIRHEARFKLDDLLTAFINSQCIHAAPEMSRLVWLSMSTGRGEWLTDFFRLARNTAAEYGLPEHSEEAWKLTDRLYAWPEQLTSIEWWNSVNRFR